jgi:hypothetical protein
VAKYSGETANVVQDLSALIGGIRTVVDAELVRREIEIERHARRRQRRSLHTGQSLNPREGLIPELRLRSGVYADHARVERHDSEPMRIEADIGRQRSGQAAQQQARDDEQHHRERDLRRPRAIREPASDAGGLRPAVPRRADRPSATERSRESPAAGWPPGRRASRRPV